MQMGSQTKMWAVKQQVALDSKIVGNVAGDCSVLHVDSNMLVVQRRGKAFWYDFKSHATKCIPGLQMSLSLTSATLMQILQQNLMPAGYVDTGP
ncbi:hypothetical protein H5410_023057 [Solanum commersonii]|uniref:Uncharacterized protein n=1 Tax=Solanum commersonii TaxID=4109 RepID=A0A9J5ZIP6_SOLCO|nr:hypothetical protein H5410_023057 [Solanum commersonii]